MTLTQMALPCITLLLMQGKLDSSGAYGRKKSKEHVLKEGVKDLIWTLRKVVYKLSFTLDLTSFLAIAGDTRGSDRPTAPA